jgi:hypothetical protein
MLEAKPIEVIRRNAYSSSWNDTSLEVRSIPNSFAYFALFAWPAVCVMLFVLLPVEAAAIWSLMGGYLLLPSATSVDVPLLPPLDKFSIPSITVFLLCWMKGPQSPPPPRSPIIYLMAFALFLSPLLSTINNSYELQIGNRSLPGFYPVDGLKLSFHNAIMVAPFFVGMRFFSSDEARYQLIKSFATAALFYSIPMLFEIRMSPQLHRWIYGFFPNSFVQQYRDGGFRPVVFLSHGLEVAIFASMAVIGSLIMMRGKWRVYGTPASLVSGYLGAVLVLCKTLGAIMYAIVAAPVVMFTGPRTWMRVSIAILLAVCAYPMLRTFDIIPVHHITQLAESISPDRSASFKMRVNNEDILLAKANQKPFFGWGTWGRNRVYEQGSGEDISVTDGTWIIQYGLYGWLGYLSFFGLFAAAVFRARRMVRGPATRSSIAVAGLSLLIAINVLDLVPNSWLLPFTYLAAGSVAAAVQVRSGAPAKRQQLNRSRAAAVG